MKRQDNLRPRVAVIVLAAGGGSRWGGARHERLHLPLDGELSVFSASLLQAIATELPLKVVTTAALAAQARQLAASRDVLVLSAEDGPASESAAPRGLGQSIARAVCACPEADGWVLLPAHAPLVRASTVLAVAGALLHHPVAFAQYRGRRGEPVGFAAELYSDLAMLSGDEGARRLVARYPAHGVEVDDPGVLVDVKSAEDLAVAQRLQREGRLAARCS